MGSADGDAVTVLIGDLIGCRGSYTCCRGNLTNGLLCPAEGFIGACGCRRAGGQFEFQEPGRRIAVGIVAAVEADRSRHNRLPALCTPFDHGLQLSDPRFLLVSHGKLCQRIQVACCKRVVAEVHKNLCTDQAQADIRRPKVDQTLDR